MRLDIQQEFLRYLCVVSETFSVENPLRQGESKRDTINERESSSVQSRPSTLVGDVSVFPLRTDVSLGIRLPAILLGQSKRNNL